MKITAVEINNIASIEGCYQINFESEPLKSVGLFAITGATGSGKSTILDAICLALFNKTPRLAPLTTSVHITDINDKTISNKDVKTLLRKGATQAHVKVTFIGIDAKYYMAEWNIRRANNKISGTIQNEEIILHQISDESVFPEKRKTNVLAEIERLIGLKYEQFTKSVILAQGEFTSFLKADDNNRADILEKLTGTDIYSKISKKIFEKYRVKKSDIETLNTKLDMYQLFSDEEIEAKNIEISELKNQVESENNRLEVYKEIDAWYKQSQVLLENISEIEKALNNKKENLINEKNRIELFNTIDTFQEIKETVIAFENANKQRNIESNQNVLNKQEIEKNEFLINEIKINLELLISKKTDIENVISTNQPLYKQARNLDSNIENLNLQLQEKQLNLLEVERNLNNEIDYLAAKKHKHFETNNSVQKINQWFNTNTAILPFVENESLITSLLKDAAQNLLEIPNAENKKINLSTEIDQIQKRILIKEAEKNKAEIQEIELKNEINNRNDSLKNLNFNELQNKRNELTTLKTLKLSHQDFFRNRFEKQTLLTEKNLISADLTSEIEQKKSLLNDVVTAKKTAIIKRETLREILEQINLERSANVVSLRENLKPDQPCPVCGSKIHEYNNHNSIEKISNETTKNYQELENSIQQLTLQDATLNEQIKQRTSELNVLENDKNQIKFELESLENQLQNNSEYLSYNVINFEDIQAFIEKELSNIDIDFNENETNINLYHSKLNEIQHFQNNLNIIQNNLKMLSDEFIDLKEKLQLLQQEEALINQNIEQNKYSFNKQIKEVSEKFKNENWYNEWQINPAQFISNYTKKASDWHACEKELEDLKNQIIQLQTEIEQVEKNINLQNTYVDKHRKEYFEIDNKLNNLKTERSKFFNGDSVDFVEDKFNVEFKKIQELITLKSSSLQEFNEKLIQLNLNFENTSESIKKHEFVINENKKIIEIWIEKQQNISFNSVLEFAKYDLEWLQNERKFIQNLNTEISNLETLFSDKKASYQKHVALQKSVFSSEEITTKIVDSQNSINAVTEKMLSIKQHLQTDETNRKQQHKLISEKNELQKITSKWNQLNELIGSADGAKFKKIAQEYTLDVLLRYANIHLNKINRRYTMQRVPNSLSLQVIDNDMACEIRSVHSLSGGESFLVSLALALALSSLSSSKMNIQSLFIDEGFGTLDAHTLAVAIDALESLQSQGKKVGVISHVQEMTERVPVKIHVDKLGNGKSSIEIQSF